MTPPQQLEGSEETPERHPAIPPVAPVADESAGMVRDTSEDSEKVEKAG